MPVIRQAFISRADIQAHPERIYLFGDNEARVGQGGQAKEMRGEPNAVGIRTKRAPGYEENAYWSDDQYEQNRAMVRIDFEAVLRFMLWEPRTVVVIPRDGLGTGLAGLSTRAPKTLAMIEKWIKLLELVSDVFDTDHA